MSEHRHDDHDHDHSHGHSHEHEQESDPSSPELRTEALESLLLEKGWITSEAIDRIVERFEHEIGPMRGAQVVARAWTDPAFKARLLADGTAAIAEFGYEGTQVERLEVKENSPGVHNVVVCTLCSCYPWAVLGLPPVWYKDFAYRSRVVREPRRVLREMGLELADDVEIRVWDSTAEIRYLVLPERPAGTQGMTADDLAPLITRDAMIGVARVTASGTQPAKALAARGPRS
jgi:nitrile hydratase